MKSFFIKFKTSFLSHKECSFFFGVKLERFVMALREELLIIICPGQPAEVAGPRVWTVKASNLQFPSLYRMPKSIPAAN